MTLIAGLRCSSGGVLICADREEASGAAKRSVDKIARFTLERSRYFIAGAGRSSILTNALPRIYHALKTAEGQGVDLLEKHREIIGSALYQVHEELIWRRDDTPEREISLVIAVSYGVNKGAIQTFLYGTDEDILCLNQPYVFDGCGKDLAYYFSDRLFGPEPQLNRQELIILAAFIFREVRESISNVGLGTDMIFVSGVEPGFQNIPYGALKQLDDALESAGIRAAIKALWADGIKNVPDWLLKESPNSDL